MRAALAAAIGAAVALAPCAAGAQQAAPGKTANNLPGVELRPSVSDDVSDLDRVVTDSIRPAFDTGDQAWRQRDAITLRGTIGRAFFYDSAEAWHLRGLANAVRPDTPEDIVGLRGAVDSAIAGSDRLRASLHDVKEAEAGVWKALARFTPTVSASLAATRTTSAFEGLGSPGRDERFGAISLSMPIFTSGERLFSFKAAKSAALSAGFQAQATRDQVALETVGSYLQHVYAGRAVELYKRDEVSLGKLLTAARAQRNAGFVSGADVAEIDAELQSRRQQLVEALATRSKTLDQVESLAGRKVHIRTEFPRLERALAGGHERLLARAVRYNAQVMAARHASESSLYASKAAFGRYLPQVNLTGEYRRDTAPATPTTNPNSWSVGVRLSMPLVDLSTVADIKASKERASAARYRSMDTQRAVGTEFANLWDDYRAARASAGIAGKKVAAQRKVAAASLAKFEKGLASMRDVLDDQRGLTGAELEELQLRVRLTYTMAQLLVTANAFDPAMLSQ